MSGGVMCDIDGREWVIVQAGYGSHVPLGEIPRDVLEGMGIDCSPLDRRPQGGIWFTKEQATAIHAHPEWIPYVGAEVARTRMRGSRS